MGSATTFAACRKLIINKMPPTLAPGRETRAWRIIAGGALLGTMWGAVARVWMRSIAEDPSFTWGGTIFILVGPTLIGFTMGIVRSRRQPTWSKVVGCVSPLLIGMAAGIIMVPTVLLGAIAIGEQRSGSGGACPPQPLGSCLFSSCSARPIISVSSAAPPLSSGTCWWLAAMVSVSYRPRHSRPRRSG
jgi:hypothetical protein